MFHEEFYPTPAHVIEMMGIDCKNKTVLEPHAGKGDIVKWLKVNGAKRVVACEIIDDLRAIVSKHCDIIGDNFYKLTSEDVAACELIVMNPPFSDAQRHIYHAWQIAPEGCEIIALCNNDNFSSCRQDTRLGMIIKSHGNRINLGSVFARSERPTNVEIALVKLYKPIVSQNLFDDFYFDEADQEAQAEGIITYNEIKALVNCYHDAVRQFDTIESAVARVNRRVNDMLEIGGYIRQVGNNALTVSFNQNYDDYSKTVSNKLDFILKLQKTAWRHAFDMMNVGKYLSSTVSANFAAFLEGQENVPFTVRNISKVVDLLFQNRADIMQQSIVSTIDQFTKHTHENRYGVEGWKTNHGSLLNKKFIVENIAAPRWGGELYIGAGQNIDKVKDLLKALCFLSGKDYNTIKGFERGEPSVWLDSEFFKFKMYKKGTAHFTFKDMKLWERLNRAYATAKGQVLPERL